MKNIVTANEELNRWCGTEGINYYEGDTALGFLFKYAVPKAVSKLADIDLSTDKEAYWKLISFWVERREKPDAIALFWALHSLIDKTP